MVSVKKDIFNHDYEFVMEDRKQPTNPPIIKVIGVGGGGSNAVNHMFRKGIKDVEFVVCNTDHQALMLSPVENKIQLGAELLEGLGGGMDSKVGEQAAEQSKQYIEQIMQPPIKMVFITAGMGGGTGTGAAPVIARIAKEAKMLTVGVVTAPYSSEGKLKKAQAIDGINKLKEYCDTVLVILNDELVKLYGKLPILRAYEHADNVLTNAVKSIAEIITVHGSVNSDFKDVERVLQGAGTSVMSAATAQGENRALDAIEEALNSPLLNNRDIRGAKKILITLASSEQEEYQATLEEQEAITDYIEELIGDEAEMCKVGVIFDNSLQDKLQVTVIAAGFEDSHLPFNYESPKKKAVVTTMPPAEKIEDIVQTPTNAVSVAITVEPPVGISQPTQQPVQKPVETIKKEILKIVEPVSEEDPTILQRLIDNILNNRYSETELNMPAYERQNVHLLEKPDYPEDAFMRIKLDKSKK
jgi:cell division protein FtsZ